MALPRDHLEALNRVKKHRFGQVSELHNLVEVPIAGRLPQFQELGRSEQENFELNGAEAD